MGRKLVAAAVTFAFAVAASAVLPDVGKASAQAGSCSCFAAFDAVDSDLRNLGRRYNETRLGASGASCAAACNTWRRDWFYRDACENPSRINRGTSATWGFENAGGETFIGTETWWCPFPPP